MKKTPKQRLRDFISRQDVTGIPAVPLIAGDHAAHLAALTVEEVCTSGKKLGQALEKTFYTYGHDLVIVFSDVTVEAEAMGAVLDYSGGGAPHISACPDITRIQPKDPEKDGRMPEILAATAYCLEKMGDSVQVCTGLKDPFSLAMMLRGSEEFLRDCIKNPALNKDILEIAALNQAAYLSAIIQTGALPLIGAPFASGSIISPGVFREFAAPYLRKLIAVIKKHRLPVFLHICGDTQIIIDEILALEPDIVSVDELDIPRCARQYEGETLFMGNLSTALMLRGSPEEIEAQTAAMINAVRLPFIPATGCDIPPRTPPENVKAMIRAVRNCRFNQPAYRELP